MEQGKQQGQSKAPHWLSGAVYVIALLAGVALIASGRANVPETSGYITPLLVIYERMSNGASSLATRGDEAGTADIHR
jgi:hypothetical protein